MVFTKINFIKGCQAISKTKVGIFYNFLSAICFYFSTFFLHKGNSIASLDPSVYAFFRQILGLVLVCIVFIFYSKNKGATKNYYKKFILPNHWIFLRCIFNALAVYAFYSSVTLKGAAISNVLNMTYPAFAVVLAVFLLGEKLSKTKAFLVLLSIFGVLLGILLDTQISFIHHRGGVDASIFFSDFLLGDNFWGLYSAFFAAIAIVSLRGANKENSPAVILFYMYVVGVLFFFFLSYKSWHRISFELLPYLLASASVGVLAQYCLTFSYKYIDIATGTIISTFRIPLALFVGVSFLSEEISFIAFLGSILILSCNILIALQSKAKSSA